MVEVEVNVWTSLMQGLKTENWPNVIPNEVSPISQFGSDAEKGRKDDPGPDRNGSDHSATSDGGRVLLGS